MSFQSPFQLKLFYDSDALTRPLAQNKAIFLKSNPIQFHGRIVSLANQLFWKDLGRDQDNLLNDSSLHDAGLNDRTK